MSLFLLYIFVSVIDFLFVCAADAASGNVSHAVALNDSAISVINNDTSVQTGGFLVPQATAPRKPKKSVNKKVKPKPKYVCTYCLKGYLDQRYFKQHVRNHAIQGTACFCLSLKCIRVFANVGV